MFLSHLFKHDLHKKTGSETELQKVQLRIFTFVTILGYIRTLQMTNLYFVTQSPIYLQLALYGLIITSSFLIILYFKPAYITYITHLSIIVTLIDLIYKTIVLGEFYITHFQVIFMMIVWSLYGLGKTFGLLYSIVFSSSILIFLNIHGIDFLVFPDKKNPDFYPIWIAYFLNNIIFICSNYYYLNKLTKIINAKKTLNKELTLSLKYNTKYSKTVTEKLKNPLHKIIGISNKLLKNNYQEQYKNDLELLKFSSESLLELINNIIYYNNIKNKKIVNEPFDLAVLLTQVYKIFKVKIHNKNIDLIFDYPQRLHNILIYSDKNKLTQVLYNLLGNAVKFTPEHGKIEIRITEIETANKSKIILNFLIQDNGIGISLDKQKDIFKPFRQADNSITRQYGGTGLGLTIVEQTLIALESEISLKTELDKGSIFSFTIEFHFMNNEKVENPQHAKALLIANN